MKDGNPTYLYLKNGTLSFNGKVLASKHEYELADRCVGSIFESLSPGENIKLAEGYFVLDNDLDLVQDWQIV